MPWEAAENRPVPSGAGRFVFVTGGPAKVATRHEATESDVKRPFSDVKRGDAG